MRKHERKRTLRVWAPADGGELESSVAGAVVLTVRLRRENDDEGIGAAAHHAPPPPLHALSTFKRRVEHSSSLT